MSIPAVRPPQIEVMVQGDALGKLDAITPVWDWEPWLTQWLEILDVSLSPIGCYEVTLQITTDKAIQTLNRDYRQQDRPTDVLAFAALETGMALPAELLAQDALYLGDIVVSLETAQRQQTLHGHTLQEEIVWLVAHGFLHLLGWDHPDEAQLHQMWQQQQLLLSPLGFGLTASAYVQEAG